MIKFSTVASMSRWILLSVLVFVVGEMPNAIFGQGNLEETDFEFVLKSGNDRVAIDKSEILSICLQEWDGFFGLALVFSERSTLSQKEFFDRNKHNSYSLSINGVQIIESADMYARPYDYTGELHIIINKEDSHLLGHLNLPASNCRRVLQSE